MLQMFSRCVLKLVGWKAVSGAENRDKYILIGAPHTSNWDFPLTLLGLSALGIRFSWIAKDSLFRWPAGYVFRKIGGIPVDRSARTGFLEEMVDTFLTREKLIVAIAPEGTRAYTDHWKAGFYHIARKSKVDVRLGFVDYTSKTVGVGPYLSPSDDIRSDFDYLERFYRNKTGKIAANKSLIRLRKKELKRLDKELHK